MAQEAAEEIHVLPYSACIVKGEQNNGKEEKQNKDSDEELYLITDRLCSSLDQHIGHIKSWQKFLAIALDVAVGICHLHEAHIIHQDIRPANVMVSSTKVFSPLLTAAA